jgi:hypothetical protein
MCNICVLTLKPVGGVVKCFLGFAFEFLLNKSAYILSTWRTPLVVRCQASLLLVSRQVYAVKQYLKYHDIIILFGVLIHLLSKFWGKIEFPLLIFRLAWKLESFTHLSPRPLNPLSFIESVGVTPESKPERTQRQGFELVHA